MLFGASWAHKADAVIHKHVLINSAHLTAY